MTTDPKPRRSWLTSWPGWSLLAIAMCLACWLTYAEMRDKAAQEGPARRTPKPKPAPATRPPGPHDKAMLAATNVGEFMASLCNKISFMCEGETERATKASENARAYLDTVPKATPGRSEVYAALLEVESCCRCKSRAGCVSATAGFKEVRLMLERTQ